MLRKVINTPTVKKSRKEESNEEKNEAGNFDLKNGGERE